MNKGTLRLAAAGLSLFLGLGLSACGKEKLSGSMVDPKQAEEVAAEYNLPTGFTEDQNLAGYTTLRFKAQHSLSIALQANGEDISTSTTTDNTKTWWKLIQHPAQKGLWGGKDTDSYCRIMSMENGKYLTSYEKSVANVDGKKTVIAYGFKVQQQSTDAGQKWKVFQNADSSAFVLVNMDSKQMLYYSGGRYQSQKLSKTVNLYGMHLWAADVKNLSDIEHMATAANIRQFIHSEYTTAYRRNDLGAKYLSAIYFGFDGDSMEKAQNQALYKAYTNSGSRDAIMKGCYYNQDVDLNKGAGGDYIAMLTVYGKTPTYSYFMGAAYQKNKHPETLSITGDDGAISSGTLTRVDGSPDLNKGAGGGYVHLYGLKSSAAPITEICIDALNGFKKTATSEPTHPDGTGWDWKPVMNQDPDHKRNKLDFNSGAGGNAIYLYYSRK